MKNKKFSGTIENWFYSRGRICGNIFYDPTSQFRDGARIITNFVVTRTAEIKEGYNVETMSSTYLLGKEAKS